MNSDIMTWNCQGFFRHYEDLHTLIHQYKPSIICLQETHLRNNQKTTIPSYITLDKKPHHNTRAHGGITIAIKNNLSFQHILIQSHL